MIWKCHDLHSFLWPSLKAAFDLAPSTAQLARLKGLMKLNQSAMEHVRCCLDHHDWIWQPGWRVWFDHWDLGFHSPTRVQTTWNIRHASSRVVDCKCKSTSPVIQVPSGSHPFKSAGHQSLVEHGDQTPPVLPLPSRGRSSPTRSFKKGVLQVWPQDLGMFQGVTPMLQL